MKTNDTTNAAPAAVMPRRADAMTATAVSTVMIAASLALLIAECDGWAACDFFALKGVAMAPTFRRSKAKAGQHLTL